MSDRLWEAECWLSERWDGMAAFLGLGRCVRCRRFLGRRLLMAGVWTCRTCKQKQDAHWRAVAAAKEWAKAEVAKRMVAEAEAKERRDRGIETMAQIDANRTAARFRCGELRNRQGWRSRNIYGQRQPVRVGGFRPCPCSAAAPSPEPAQRPPILLRDIAKGGPIQ